MRYLLLVILNLPIILLALLNQVTRYKLRQISHRKYIIQLVFWSILLVILIGSYPIYNLLTGNPSLDSNDLSLLDIIQTTTVIALLYAVNALRRRVDESERRLRELHEELSIKLSACDGKS